MPIVPSGEARSSQVVVSSDTEALNCERQKRYPSEATSLILARLDADPACDDRAIASEIGPDWDAQRVRRCITHLIRERGLVERVEEVRSLVVNHPHIQDQGIRERTGLSDLDIHLILHDELVSGRMRL